MGKPRMILVIRHAQSEGNRNRAIHQFTPDHRVQLTPEGWEQAEDAGRRLRAMLRPDDTLHFFTSPYRRTRETTEGILKSLTSDEPAPSPFPRQSIKVWEEPRLREQDFGNFQPCSDEMERMWKERAEYGHFFYRIPNGESAADAYDRISGFNETLWRNFAEDDFASVCVLVTHGLMTRVFLMKWYHWSVEYFEDLRNVNHCEFIVMKRSEHTGKFMLQNELRTWSDLKRQKELEAGEHPTARSPYQYRQWNNPEPPKFPAAQRPASGRPRRQTTKDPKSFAPLLGVVAAAVHGETAGPGPDHSESAQINLAEEDSEAFPHVNVADAAEATTPRAPPGKPDLSALGFAERLREAAKARPVPSYLEAGRDFGGSSSGYATPTGGFDETPHGPPMGAGADYGFPHMQPKSRSPKSPRASHLRTDSSQWQLEHANSGSGSASPPDAPLDSASLEEQETQDKSLQGSVY